MRLKYKVLASTALAATMLTGTALAANLSPTAGNTTYSREGVALQPSNTPVSLPFTSVTLQAQYAETDIIDVTVVGPALASTTAPVMTCPVGIQIGFLGRTGNVSTFRVTQVQTGFSTVGVGCTLSGFTATGAAIAGVNNVVVNYAARTAGGTAIDTGCVGLNCVANSATVATVRNQFNAVTTTPLDAVVDVNALRYEFVAPDTDDSWTFAQWTDGNVNPLTPPNPADAAVFSFPATVTAASAVLSGDFNWLDANDNGTCTLAEYQAAVTTSVGAITAGAANCTSVTIAQTTAEGSVTVTLTPLPPASQNVLPAQIYSAVVTLSYDNGANPDINVPFNLAAGEWTLNGFSAFVGYMPFGEGISQIIYAANSSSQVGDISIDGYNEAGVSCAFNAGSMPANSTKQLSGAIKAGFQACYGATFTGKVAFDVVINIPSSAGDLYSAYNVNSVDRGTVVNSANGK